MDLERKDKVVLITGGSKGIGAAISRALAAEAAIPLIVDRDLEAANAPHPQLPCSELVIAELSSHESCYAAIDHAVRTFSGRDALVHNAGVNDKVGLEHGSPQKYFELLERNLLHYHKPAHFALPHHKVAGPHRQHRLQGSAGRIPLEKRRTAPEEIAAMVLFLLSARAAHITAQPIFVDGGYVHPDRALK